MPGEGGSPIGRAYVEIVVPRAEFQANMAGIGSIFSAQTAGLRGQGQAMAAAIAAANVGLANSYSMVTPSLIGLNAAQQAARATGDGLTVAMQQGAVSTRLLAAGAVDLSQGLATAGKGIDATRGSLIGFGGQLQSIIAIMAAFTAVSKTLGFAQTAVDAQIAYNKELQQLWTMTDMTAEENVVLGETIRDISTEYNVMAAAGVGAMYEIYSALFTGADAAEIFESSIKAAAAGVTDVMTAVDITTTVLNAYNMAASEADRVNDMMFQTVIRGKTIYAELAEQFGRLAGIAAPLGIPMEQMFAGIATLTRRGIETDEAVTALRQTLMQMLRPTNALDKAIKSLGYDSGIAMAKANGFAGTLKLLKKYAEETDTPFSDMFTNVRALMGVFPLATTAFDEYILDLEAMENSSGVMTVAFEKVALSWEYQLQHLKSQINDAAISIGGVLLPSIVSFTGAMGDLATIMSKMFEMLGPLGQDIAKFTGYMAAGIAVAGGLAAAIWALRAAFTALAAHPVVMAVLAIGAVLGVLGGYLGELLTKTEDNVDKLEEYRAELARLRREAGIPITIAETEVPSLVTGPLPNVNITQGPSQTLGGELRTAAEWEQIVAVDLAQPIIDALATSMKAAVAAVYGAAGISPEDMAQSEVFKTTEADGIAAAQALGELAVASAELAAIEQRMADELATAAVKAEESAAAAEAIGTNLIPPLETQIPSKTVFGGEEHTPAEWEQILGPEDLAKPIVDALVESMTDAIKTRYAGEIYAAIAKQEAARQKVVGTGDLGIEGLLASQAELAISSLELAAIQKAVANETDATATIVAEAFGYTLTQVRGFGLAMNDTAIAAGEVRGVLTENVAGGAYDWFAEMWTKVTTAIGSLDPSKPEESLKAMADLEDYYSASKEMVELFTAKGWAGVEMMTALRDRIAAAIGAQSGWVAETYALITAFGVAQEGSAEQADILSDLAGRYKTATGWVAALKDVGIQADPALLKVIDDLEGLGITAGKTAEEVERAIDILASAVSGIGDLVSKWGGEGAQGIGATISSVGGTISALGAATAVGAGPMAWIALGIAAIDTIFTAWDELVTKPAAAAAEEMAASLEEAVAAAQAVAASFWNVVSSSEEVAAIQEGLGNTLVSILNELLGFLWPIVSIFDAIAALFSIEEKTVAEIVTSTQETLSDLNVPLGFPINRIRFGAATPGEPVVYSFNKTDETKTKAEEILEWWKEALLEYTGTISEAIQPIKDFIDTLKEAYTQVFPDIIAAVLPVLETFGWTLDQISNWIETQFIDDLSAFAQGFATFWTDKVDPMWKNELFPQISEWLDRIYGWLDAIIAFFSTEGWDWLSTDVWGAVKPFVDTVLDMFQEFGQWVHDNWDTIKVELLDKLQTYLGGIVGNLGTWLGNVKTWLSGGDPGFSALNLAIQFVTGLLNALGGVLAIGKGAFILFFNLLGLLMNAVIAPVNAVLAAINFTLGWLGVHLTPIPYFAWTPLAEGGIAMSEMLARIGEQGPEVVAPLSALPGIMSDVMRSMPITYGQELGAGNPLSPSAQYAGGGGGVTINVNLSQQRLSTIMMREMVSANVNDTGVGFAPVRL